VRNGDANGSTVLERAPKIAREYEMPLLVTAEPDADGDLDE
jgi:hypothetical protein